MVARLVLYQLNFFQTSRGEDFYDPVNSKESINQLYLNRYLNNVFDIAMVGCFYVLILKMRNFWD